jgi:excisionase family DNA binding protein
MSFTDMKPDPLDNLEFKLLSGRFTISIEGACNATGLSRSTIYKLIADGELERIHIGRRALITVKSIILMIRRRTSTKRNA